MSQISSTGFGSVKTAADRNMCLKVFVGRENKAILHASPFQHQIKHSGLYFLIKSKLVHYFLETGNCGRAIVLTDNVNSVGDQIIC